MITKTEMLTALNSLEIYLEAVEAAQARVSAWRKTRIGDRPALPSSIKRPDGIAVDGDYGQISVAQARSAINWLNAIDENSTPSIEAVSPFMSPRSHETDIPAARFAAWAFGTYKLTGGR